MSFNNKKAVVGATALTNFDDYQQQPNCTSLEIHSQQNQLANAYSRIKEAQRFIEDVARQDPDSSTTDVGEPARKIIDSLFGFLKKYHAKLEKKKLEGL